jgi:hypothetical protein
MYVISFLIIIILYCQFIKYPNCNTLQFCLLSLSSLILIFKFQRRHYRSTGLQDHKKKEANELEKQLSISKTVIENMNNNIHCMLDENIDKIEAEAISFINNL